MPGSTGWRVDETYVRVRGKWAYLYRAVDKFGSAIEFRLSPTRNARAAKRFLGKALKGLKSWEQPRIVNTDKAPAHAAALAELGAEGKCPEDPERRRAKRLNSIVEAGRGFKTLKSAYAAIEGFEAMRALRKGRGSAFNLANGMNSEARMIERAFGPGPCGLSEAMPMLENRPAA